MTNDVGEAFWNDNFFIQLLNEWKLTIHSPLISTSEFDVDFK